MKLSCLRVFSFLDIEHGKRVVSLHSICRIFAYFALKIRKRENTKIRQSWTLPRRRVFLFPHYYAKKVKIRHGMNQPP